MNLAQLFNPVEKIVGLEITSGHLRAVLLEKNKKGGLKITKKSSPLAQGMIENGQISNKLELSLALKKFRQENKSLFKSKYIILALPPMFVFYEIMKFPAITDEQINESIALNINTKTLFPFEAGEIYYDWEPVKLKDPIHREAAVAFAMKEYIKDWMEVCESAELEPLAFEIPSASITRALENFNDKSGVVIRIIKEGLEIFIASDKKLALSRFVQMPGIGNLDEFKSFIKNELGKTLRFYQAERPHDLEIKHAIIISQL
ncbi:MAG: pilus assembly protein PilM, partial [Patescibacteria group bacterium]